MVNVKTDTRTYGPFANRDIAEGLVAHLAGLGVVEGDIKIEEAPENANPPR